MDIIEKTYELDHSILLFIQEYLRFDFLTPIMKISSMLGNIGAIWILSGILLVLFKKTRMIGVIMLSSLTLCFLINNVCIKNIVARARPFDTYSDLIPLIKKPTDYSFASGHTTAAFASSGILARFLRKPLAVLTIVFSFLIAYSRLYLGVHYPTDVICGFIIGVLGSMLTYYIFSKKFDVESYRLSRNIEK